MKNLDSEDFNYEADDEHAWKVIYRIKVGRGIV